MKYKVLVLNQTKKTLDFTKDVDYWANHVPNNFGIGLDVEYCLKNTTIPFKMKSKVVDGKTRWNVDAEDLAIKIRQIVKDKEYDEVMFVYLKGDANLPSNADIRSNTPPTMIYPTTALTTIKYNSKDLWLTVNHERHHAIERRAWHKGFNVSDQMDNTWINGKWENYYKNSEPYALDGNRAVTLNIFKPYWNQMFGEVIEYPYRPKNFTLKELVSPTILAKYGEKAWEFLDERTLRNLQFLRDNLGPIRVNTSTLRYRGFDACEFRKEGVSQHNHGRAIDCDVIGRTSEQVRQWVVQNQDRFPEPNMWVEVGVPHFHFDCRYSDKKGVYLFNP